MTKHFADRLIEAIKKKGNPICVGLDPRLDKIPAYIVRKALDQKDKSPTTMAVDAILEFNKGIIDAVCDLVPAVKPQIAFYEIYGHNGIWCYEQTLKYAKSKGLLTIADVKRNDIGSTAEAYAQAYLGEVSMFGGENEVITPIFDADSLTVNPYLGWDGVKPFVEECKRYGKGIFVLVKTSNKSSGDLQDLEMKDGKTVYEVLGHLVDSWGANETGKSGYSFVGAVVGATYPSQAKLLRKIMPNTIFLVPGYGAQGGTAEDVKVCFNKDGLGAIVNNSRGIIFAYEKMGMPDVSYCEAARAAVLEMKKDLE
ncbi:orotidine 5'-phosphate decarboxylase [Candidatus Peregrinibacteria bacterium RIFCSPLOWO2_01_FULL_39_12]|nr:MAG: orotidine 5'-phosphate decarboxylase [Candidatus Peregrinibacteria bacterium RIFCSPLOWO2_01_FULL_39_12]OGJ43721.1 MAG: orotidine 5'-phosphate decarboxylase [Candidatus Peregrinibacteria bacterium RIFCSPLOWO2_02_FULL_39_10]